MQINMYYHFLNMSESLGSLKGKKHKGYIASDSAL